MNIELSNIFNQVNTPKILFFILLVVISLVIITSYPDNNYLDLKNTPEMVIKPHTKQVYSGLNAPLFGHYEVQISPGDIIKKSLVQLEIVGIIHSQNDELSQVIIRMADGQDKTFRLHEKINNNLEVVKILADSIIVKRNNLLESLHMPKDHLNYYDLKNELLT